MKTVQEVKDEIERLVDYYTGKEFAKCIVAERGYHLVRALDDLTEQGWFAPWKPVINYRCKGPNEIEITILEYHPINYKLTVTQDDIKDD